MLSNGRIIPTVAIFMCFNCLNCELLVSSVCTQFPGGQRQRMVPELLGRRDLGKMICLDFFFFLHVSFCFVNGKWEFLPPSFEALKT